MKKIFHIARNELHTLFYSPIAWILMILFVVLTSADYIGVTDFYLMGFEKGGLYLRAMKDLTTQLTANPPGGYLFKVIKNLYIFFPLITMGLISRETSSGTIKLLYSSPIRVREIVLGKYVAVLCFTFCLLALVVFTYVGVAISLENPDYGQMLASLLGLFLVLATYAAIGLFISALTSYQIVAAIITLGLFALFSNVGDLWQEIEAARNITYYLNIGEKSFNFIRGLMNLRDLFYFIILIATFLCFTTIRIKAATESVSVGKKTMRYLLVVTIAFVVGYITSRPQLNVYVDATRDQIYTITPPTQSMLAKLSDGELEIIGFSNLFQMSRWRFLSSQQNSIVSNVWEPYIRFKPDIKVKFQSYYDLDTNSYHYKLNPDKTIDEIAEKEAKTFRTDIEHYLTPDQVNQLVDVKEEEFRSFFLLKYKDKTTIVRTFDDQEFWPSENEIAAAINQLIDTAPKVVFLSDEIERSPFLKRTRDYSTLTSSRGFRYSLINQGYDFDTLSLKQRDIPDGIAALAIADPRTPISASNLEKISKYIDQGGNLFIASEPDRKEVTKPLFDKLGLSLRDGLLIQPNDYFSSHCAFAVLTDTAKDLSPQFAQFITDETKYRGDSVFRVAMEGASAIEYQEKDGFQVEPLLYTDSTLSWNRLAPISEDSLQLEVERLPSDERGSFVTALGMKRVVNGKEQRIVVTSDADFLTRTQSAGTGYPYRYNFEFGFWSFSRFSYGAFPANTLRPQTDDKFRVTVNSIPKQKVIYYWIIPALIALIASIILIRRKRK
ncbi:hypothetical protein GCM10011386_26800 [Parapedobacter defluvii]|uniref:ABC-type uncharacterized transport system domain-containing protein n=1 Tax=Parapedobacter defluvii TaxID=2045106 RepID=A0ABQ1M2F9_9SPHI|nr:Gldg family protein [Parapedobacter defluvii]GGC33335.1 hypothetical protein GCM10011386_26800 [Parapedobacter defluvii]